MKLQITKTGVAGRKTVRGTGFSVEVTTKTLDVEIPARGLIETQDIKLLVFTNSAKQIIKFELTCGGTKHVYKGDHPFIMWAELEQEIENYLATQKPQATEEPLVGLGKKRKTKKA